MGAAILVVEAGLGYMEGRRQVEDRPAVLAGDHPPGAERPAVAGPLDVVDDRHVGVTGTQEVRVQGVDRPPGFHRSARGDQRLAGDLAAEHPLQPGLRLPATEEVVLDLLQVEELEELPQ